MRQCQVDGTTCATTGTYSTVVMSSDAALESWISHSSGVLTIAPTSGSLQASNTWDVKVTWTPDYGQAAVTYTALQITVTCEITSFTISNTPANQAYNIFD